MASEQDDESLGVEQLPQSELEASPGSGTDQPTDISLNPAAAERTPINPADEDRSERDNPQSSVSDRATHQENRD